ncbi:MAG TPA: hypothetical protein VMD29_07720 [Terracidiphilus sp.]|nr:hypothetical protein [Terracidiphilus sp.]
MGSTVQTRLDRETLELMQRLNYQGFKTSEILRKGVHLFAREVGEACPIHIIGLGEFDSGIPDLASNKKHLEGLGRSSMPRGKKRIQRKSKG